MASLSKDKSSPKSKVAKSALPVDELLGQQVPLFSLVTNRELTKFGDWSEKYCVLFFYPKDMTSGCTLEAIDFNNHLKKFKKMDVRILGISPDSLNSHNKFCLKEGFSLELVSDETKEISQWFKVFKEKSMYGRKYMGIERSTFLIDRDGKIIREWRKVKVQGHVEEVIEAIEEL